MSQNIYLVLQQSSKEAIVIHNEFFQLHIEMQALLKTPQKSLKSIQTFIVLCCTMLILFPQIMPGKLILVLQKYSPYLDCSWRCELVCSGFWRKFGLVCCLWERYLQLRQSLFHSVLWGLVPAAGGYRPEPQKEGEKIVQNVHKITCIAGKRPCTCLHRTQCFDLHFHTLNNTCPIHFQCILKLYFTA